MKTIDHYGHWTKARTGKQKILSREINSLKLISKVMKRDGSFLDAGCGNGFFMEFIRRLFPKVYLSGLDYSKSEVLEARKRGFKVKQSDFGEGIDFPKDKFDLVYAGEVIEHLYDPDFFLEEANRILKPNGFLVISTPNLCAWFNRIFMFLGIQPLFVEPSTKSKFVGSGFLKRFKEDSNPVGHVRIFTLEALKDMFKMYGFKVLEVRGNPYEEGFPKKLSFIDKIFAKISPGLAGQFVILVQKK
ncbi:hypothetical protein COU54_00590 [Candidatus Pacearchaeota archaeon CG10_big_fil_rev_8_21_14_0_10_31_24]|nr:MAG: hypothetical protein COU54_00590 [Candidatus Pacearchaeota archaeon CG10_big_fil_rev_8_21_14_0_10_31_24]